MKDLEPKKSYTASQLTQFAIEFLTRQGCYVWRNQVRGAMRRKNVSKKGVGDVIGMTPAGLHIEVEIKTGKDVISEEQQLHHNSVENHHALYFVIRSPDDLMFSWHRANRPRGMEAR